MHDPNCIFCKIIDREIPGNILEENDDVIVFMSLENHPLIVPKKHIPDIYSLDEKTGAEIMKTSIRMAKRVKEEFKCDGIYIAQANGSSAGQEVFHYHMHIYPRFKSN